MRALDGRLDEFRAAAYDVREKIVEDSLGSFRRALNKGSKFDEVTIRTVREQLTIANIELLS